MTVGTTQLAPGNGHNYIINGAFDIWQRGTSTSVTNAVIYTADRWVSNDFSGSAATITRQSFTPGNEIAGYEYPYYLRWDRPLVTSGVSYLMHRVEDARTLAGQPITISFWAKASSSVTMNFYFERFFGSGGSTNIGFGGTDFALTTSWQRFTHTVTSPSVVGKTIGDGSFMGNVFNMASAKGAFTIDIWGVQLEAGSVATPFKRHAPSLQGELAACQRYFQRLGGDLVNDRAFGTGWFITSDTSLHPYTLPVEMRAAPTASASAGGTFYLYRTTGATIPTSVGVVRNTKQNVAIFASASGTANTPTNLIGLGTANAFIDLSAEL